MELIMIPKLKSAIIQIKSNVKLVEILSNQLEFDLKSKFFLQVTHCQSDFSFHQLSQNMTTDFQGTYLNCKCLVQVFVLFIFQVLRVFLSFRDLSRDDCIEEFIKRI